MTVNSRPLTILFVTPRPLFEAAFSVAGLSSFLRAAEAAKRAAEP